MLNRNTALSGLVLMAFLTLAFSPVVPASNDKVIQASGFAIHRTQNAGTTGGCTTGIYVIVTMDLVLGTASVKGTSACGFQPATFTLNGNEPACSVSADRVFCQNGEEELTYHLESGFTFFYGPLSPVQEAMGEVVGIRTEYESIAGYLDRTI